MTDANDAAVQFERALDAFEANHPAPRLRNGEHCACCRHDPQHDPDSELALAVSALQTLELLLVSSEMELGPGVAELLEPITARVNAARLAYRDLMEAR